MTAQVAEVELRSGVSRLIEDYAQIGTTDRVVIAYTPDSRESAAHLILGLQERGIKSSAVAMKPLIDPEFSARLNSALSDLPHGASLVIFTLELDTMSHFEPLVEAMRKNGPERTRIIRIISACDEFFTHAMNLSPNALTGLNAAALSMLDGRHHYRITTEAGTDLSVEVDSGRYDWISNRGVWRPGSFTILPAGEVATYPVRIDGTLVADGAINCNIIARMDMRLGPNPLTVTIQNSRAVAHHCENPELAELVRLAFKRENGSRIGELGFGTNKGIPEFIEKNSHINERRSGVHIGFGQHNQDYARVAYHEDIHLDVITDDARIYVNEDTAGFLMSELEDTGMVHPQYVRDEDITGDCCGVPYGVLKLDD